VILVLQALMVLLVLPVLKASQVTPVPQAQLA
jgi:hypothetical protein